MKKIINNILHRFKEDSLSRRTELVDRTLAYKELKEIRTCLLFYTAGAEPQAGFEILKKKMPEVKFRKLGFVPSGVEVGEADDLVTFRNEELGFGGRIQNDHLYKELSREYDLLVDFTALSNAMTQYVLTNSKAHCIIGMKKEGTIADIIIDEVKEPQEFAIKLTGLLAEIKRYGYETI